MFEEERRVHGPDELLHQLKPATNAQVLRGDAPTQRVAVEEQRAEEAELAAMEALRQTTPNHALLRDFVAFLQCNMSRIQESGLNPADVSQLEEALSAAK